MKTSELEGALLDYWVARAENEMNPRFENGLCVILAWTIYSPSTDWLTGGPLIEKYNLDLVNSFGGGYFATSLKFTTEGRKGAEGKTPLQAICRAVVRAAFGDEVGEVA